jgi:hypothetical protein
MKAETRAKIDQTFPVICIICLLAIPHAMFVQRLHQVQEAEEAERKDVRNLEAQVQSLSERISVLEPQPSAEQWTAENPTTNWNWIVITSSFPVMHQYDFGRFHLNLWKTP